MISHISGTIVLIALFGSLFLGLILALIGLRDGSFLCQSCRSELVFRKRLALRVFMAMTGFFVSVWGPIGFWYTIIDASDRPEIVVSVSIWAVFGLLSIATGILLIRFSGPEDLHLNLSQHTYRLVSGWPLFSVNRSGKWDDIAGIYVHSFGNSSVEVGISWRYNKKHRTALGRFGRRQLAYQFAQDIASKLGLPQIVLPI